MKRQESEKDTGLTCSGIQSYPRFQVLRNMSGLTLDQSWWLCQPLQRVAAASPHVKSYPRVKACQQNEAMLDLAVTHMVVLYHTQGTASPLVSDGGTEILCALSKKLGPQRRKL